MDASNSFTQDIPLAVEFLADLLSEYTIGPDDTQVCLIKQLTPAVVVWNWQSAETANYDVLIQNINETLETVDDPGNFNDGFLLALSDVIDSQYDRETAVNIVLNVGDGQGTASMPNLVDIATRAWYVRVLHLPLTC